MMGVIHVWRICHKKYYASAFSGDGARLFGGRFNSEGYAAVYTSGSLSLSILEMMVQVNDRSYLKDCVTFSAEIPESMIWIPDEQNLPDTWNNLPYETATQYFGDAWLKSVRSPVMKVPSVVVPVEYNFILNPAHPDFKRIMISRVDKLSFDRRLFV